MARTAALHKLALAGVRKGQRALDREPARPPRATLKDAEAGARPEDAEWATAPTFKAEGRFQSRGDLNMGPDEGKPGFPEGWLESLECGSEHDQGSSE